MSRVVIVVPCYNEADRLDPRRFEDFVRRQDRVDFLLVNDGSRDNTQAVLDRLAAVDPRRLSVLALPANGGKAEAVRRGMLAALARRPQYVGFWDADLATPLEDITDFCQVLDEKPSVELVIGTRLPLLGRRIERDRVRGLSGRLFSTVASLALGVRFRDTQCGAKLLRVTSRAGQLFADPFVSHWVFDVELLARLALSQSQVERAQLEQIVYEQPLDEWRDVAGSKVRGRDFVRAFIDMTRIYWTYLRPYAGWSPTAAGSVELAPQVAADLAASAAALPTVPDATTAGERRAA